VTEAPAIVGTGFNNVAVVFADTLELLDNDAATTAAQPHRNSKNCRQKAFQMGLSREFGPECLNQTQNATQSFRLPQKW